MANRSYLYALDFDPAQRPLEPQDKVSAIGEWNYDVPLACRLLLSSAPRSVPSLLFDDPQPLAALGEFRGGLAALYAYLDELSGVQLVDESTRRWYRKPKAWQWDLSADAQNTRAFFAGVGDHRYFLLECAELYDMDEEAPEVQHASLLRSLQHLDEEKQKFLDLIHKYPRHAHAALGIQGWSDVLYYQIGKE